LRAGATMVADAGSYSITGTAASLEQGSLIAADSGSYTITGTNATLTKTAISQGKSKYYWRQNVQDYVSIDWGANLEDYLVEATTSKEQVKEIIKDLKAEIKATVDDDTIRFLQQQIKENEEKIRFLTSVIRELKQKIKQFTGPRIKPVEIKEKKNEKKLIIVIIH
jgi:hypothetical protein